RPLVSRRFPDGIRGKAFYRQRAPADAPPGVRVQTLPVDTEVPSRLIGGSLITLLYMAQIAAISQDPWFSRVGSLDDADHVVLDLDPMPGVPFATVVDVARLSHDELERIGTPSVPKTSGATGMHVYIPLPPRTSYETGRIFCEIVATLVAERHPRVATVERAVDARGRRVYIDYMQNFRGKTLATAYSARGSDFAGASTPLTWREVHAGVDHRDFTLTTLPARVRRVGDLWAPLRTSSGADITGHFGAAHLQMTDAWGIADGYHDAFGEWRAPTPATHEALLRAMGAEGEAPPPAPVIVRRAGERIEVPARARLVLEDGAALDFDGTLPVDIPPGYHELRPGDDGPPIRLIVSPGRCPVPSRRGWGWAAQLYATRSSHSWGIGDLSDLRALSRWAAGLGASTILINPLSAPLPLRTQQSSPYYPSSRRFVNPLYLRIEDVPGATTLGGELERLAT